MDQYAIFIYAAYGIGLTLIAGMCLYIITAHHNSQKSLNQISEKQDLQGKNGK